MLLLENFLLGQQVIAINRFVLPPGRSMGVVEFRSSKGMKKRTDPHVFQQNVLYLTTF